MASPIRILHIEDDRAFADMTATYLEREDERFAVETATSGSDGLDRLTADVDCVVTDYEMPGMNGIDLVDAVRANQPDLPVILFTGNGSEAVASDAISAGVTDYVQKQPGTEQYELLGARIRTAVGQYRAEKELDRQNDLFRKAQDLAEVGAWEYVVEDEATYFTDKVYDIYGVDTDYEPAPEQDVQRFYHPDDRDTVREAMDRAWEAGEPYDIEVRITAADGTEKWIRTLGEPTVEDGTCVRVRGTIRDITERKRRERELRRQNERLDEFASVVSHDLRNPLQVLAGSLEHLEADDDETLDRCQQSVERMEHLLEDLLTLARQGEAATDAEPVRLDVVANECVQTTLAPDMALSVETDATVVAEDGRLRQLFENLFSNAVEHGSTTPDSQAQQDTVARDGPDATITVGELRRGFYVEDDGSGIPESERAAVFEPGYSTRADGTGFGLNIVSEVAEAHGWDIRVTDGETGGARFEITGVEFADR